MRRKKGLRGEISNHKDAEFKYLENIWKIHWCQLSNAYCDPLLVSCSPDCDPHSHRGLCIWRSSHSFRTSWTDFSKERLHLWLGYTGECWEPGFSGVGCQVQRCVATPHLRGMVSPWISQIGVYDITNTWSLAVGAIGGYIGPGQATTLIVCLEIIKLTNNFLRSGALKIFSWESTLQCQSGERKNKHCNWKTPASPMYHRHVCVSCLSDPADAEIYSRVHMSLGHCLWTQTSGTPVPGLHYCAWAWARAHLADNTGPCNCSHLTPACTTTESSATMHVPTASPWHQAYTHYWLQLPMPPALLPCHWTWWYQWGPHSLCGHFSQTVWIPSTSCITNNKLLSSPSVFISIFDIYDSKPSN